MCFLELYCITLIYDIDIDLDIEILNSSLSKYQVVGNVSIHVMIENIIENTILSLIDSQETSIDATLISVNLTAIDQVYLVNVSDISDILLSSDWQNIFSFHLYVRVWYFGNDIGEIVFNLFATDEDVEQLSQQLLIDLSIIFGDTTQLFIDCDSISAQSDDFVCGTVKTTTATIETSISSTEESIDTDDDKDFISS